MQVPVYFRLTIRRTALFKAGTRVADVLALSTLALGVISDIFQGEDVTYSVGDAVGGSVATFVGGVIGGQSAAIQRQASESAASPSAQSLVQWLVRRSARLFGRALDAVASWL
jgi:hypothetical protein